MNNKILAIFANHTCSVIKYNISLRNMSLLKEKVTNIVIIDTKDEEYSNKLYNDLHKDNKIINYFLVENDNYFDFGKWMYVLKMVNYKDYDYVLFINDSIILLDQLDNFFIYFQNNLNTNLYAYNDSTQIRYHYQSYLFFIKSNSIKDFINFFESKKPNILDLESLIQNVELNMCNIIDNHDCFLKLGTEWNMEKNLYWENESLYQYLLSKNIFSIIKLKKIFDMQKGYKIDIYGSSISNFDYNFYRDYYDDLKLLSNTELLDHFIENGQYEGRKFNSSFKVILPDYYRDKLDNIGLLYFFDVPKDFDVYYYKQNYQDIKTLSILETVFHYINHGVYEGRVYNKENNKCNYINKTYLTILDKMNHLNDNFIKLPDNFNINEYVTLNDKLIKLGHMALIKHYIQYGCEQKLEYKISIDRKEKLKNFNANIYRKLNKELYKLSNIELEDHYIKYGKDKIYNIPSDFNVNMYKKIYKDLNSMNKEELIDHYIIHGICEGRIYKPPDDFYCNNYRKMNNDLKDLTDDDLIDHYLSCGINEGRLYKIPDEFNHSNYKKIYKDLKDFTNKELETHYILFGHREGRIYKLPDDFDVINYKKIYSDLSHLNDSDLIEHYLSYGVMEKRIYKIPDDFDHEIYKRIYPDLSSLSNEKLEEHYLYDGLKESKLYKVPDDFNYESYKMLNSDLRNFNKNELIDHFIKHGIREKRIYK